jgi:hypothetical protein
MIAQGCGRDKRGRNLGETQPVAKTQHGHPPCWQRRG